MHATDEVFGISLRTGVHESRESRDVIVSDWFVLSTRVACRTVAATAVFLEQYQVYV